jgi:hypothetical protein
MFRASSCPTSGAKTNSVAASGLPLELGDSSAVGRGRRISQTAILNGKTHQLCFTNTAQHHTHAVSCTVTLFSIPEL